MLFFVAVEEVTVTVVVVIVVVVVVVIVVIVVVVVVVFLTKIGSIIAILSLSFILILLGFNKSANKLA